MYNWDPKLNSTGGMWAWTRSGSVWSQRGLKFFRAEGDESADRFQGWSVAVSKDGSTIANGGNNLAFVWGLGPPTASPTARPTIAPTSPTPFPTQSPTAPTTSPSNKPSVAPTTAHPTYPTNQPTRSPTSPTSSKAPTNLPIFPGISCQWQKDCQRKTYPAETRFAREDCGDINTADLDACIQDGALRNCTDAKCVKLEWTISQRQNSGLVGDVVNQQLSCLPVGAPVCQALNCGIADLPRRDNASAPCQGLGRQACAQFAGQDPLGTTYNPPGQCGQICSGLKFLGCTTASRAPTPHSTGIVTPPPSPTSGAGPGNATPPTVSIVTPTSGMVTPPSNNVVSSAEQIYVTPLFLFFQWLIFSQAP